MTTTTMQAAPPGHAGLPGGGPWIILPNCPAPTHNSLRAARGRGQGGGITERPAPRCICPRGQVCIEQDKKRKREVINPLAKKRARPRPVKKVAEVETRDPSYLSAINQGVFAPHLDRGLCVISPRAAKTILAAGERGGSPLHARARKLCDEVCPVRAECGAWVKQAEKPAGAWHGFIGGQTQVQRRDAGRRG